jgi:hypothetical protein
MNHIYSRSNGIVLSHIAHVDDVLKTSGGELAGLRRGKTQAPLVMAKAPPPEEIEETSPVAAAAEAAPEKQGRSKKAKAEDPPPPEDSVETL